MPYNQVPLELRLHPDYKKKILPKVLTGDYNFEDKLTLSLIEENKNGKRKRIIISMDEYPDLYDKLTKLSYINIRSVEQQALFYIMQAVGETQVEVKENDECE